MLGHRGGVEGFEIPVVRLIEENLNRHDLTVPETPGALALSPLTGEQMGLPLRTKGLAEGIDIAKQFE